MRHHWNCALALTMLLAAPIAPRAATHAALPEVLPFIQDDYSRALAEARTRHIPILVNATAPWCHTCKSMEAFVLTDPALGHQAGKFVWLEINTELARNASLVKRLNLDAYPTFYVLDPATEAVALRWVGGATVSQFDKILDQGALAVSRGSKEAPASDTNHPANEALRRADEAYSKGNHALAAAAYGEAIALAPEGWQPYTRAVDSRLYALQRLDSTEAQIRLAQEALPRVQQSPTLASVGSGGLSAALSLPATDSRRTALVQAFEAASAQALRDPGLHLAGDDRAALYDAIVSAREDRKDSLGAHEMREEWAAFLVDQIHLARSPEQRTSFDPHILGLYLDMGTPAKALPFLQVSERDFPEDYNPPARQAAAYKAMKDWKNALAASDRAMALAYGPRKLGIYSTRVDILLGMGNTDGARHSLEEAIKFAESLPEEQRSPTRIAAFKKKLAGLQQPTGSAQ